jgi:hypothetical protein
MENRIAYIARTKVCVDTGIALYKSLVIPISLESQKLPGDN